MHGRLGPFLTSGLQDTEAAQGSHQLSRGAQAAQLPSWMPQESQVNGSNRAVEQCAALADEDADSVAERLGLQEVVRCQQDL